MSSVVSLEPQAGKLLRSPTELGLLEGSNFSGTLVGTKSTWREFRILPSLPDRSTGTTSLSHSGDISRFVEFEIIEAKRSREGDFIY